MKEGSVSSFIRTLIRNEKYKNNAIISTDDVLPEIQDGIDLSEMSREELEERYVKTVMWCVMNQEDYYSIERGNGMYINYSLFQSGRFQKIIKDKLQQNFIKDAEADMNAVKILERLYQRKKVNENPQFGMDFDEDMNMTGYSPEPTSDDILRLIEDLYVAQKAREISGQE